MRNFKPIRLAFVIVFTVVLAGGLAAQTVNTPPTLQNLNLERVLAFGDEWFPNRVGSDEQMIGRCRELARLAAEAGREPIPVTLALMPRDPARIAAFAEVGVHRGVYWLPAGGPDAVEAAMDRVAAAAEAYRQAGG